MDEKINFVEIAENIVANFKENIAIPQERTYNNSPLFVSIDEDENIRVSFLPNVLSDAKECMIILVYNQKHTIAFYPHYQLFRIKEDGNVQKGYSKLGWEIMITGRYYTSPSQIILRKNNTDVFCKLWKGEESLYELWKVYKVCKDCTTAKEVELIVKNFKLEEELEALKGKNKELELLNKIADTTMEQYENVLEEIKIIVE